MRSPILLAAIFLVLTTLPAGSASPGSGAVAFEGAPFLSGVLSGTGGGEFRLTGVDATLTADGTGLSVRRVFTERSYMETPTGGRVELDVQEAQEEGWTRASGQVVVVPDPRFASLVMADDGGAIVLPDTAIDRSALPVLESPRLVVDEQGRVDPDSRSFTYQADGPRARVEGLPKAEATGAFSFYVSDATIRFTGPDGEETWEAGAYRVEDGPQRYREGVAWFVLTFADGALTGAASGLTVWFEEPTLTLVGTVQGEEASGAIRVDGTEYRFAGREVRLEGTLELRPAPAGDLVADGERYVGTAAPRASGQYSRSAVTLSGDVTHIAVAGQGAASFASDGATLAAAVGIAAAAAGAAVLLSPGLKWSLLSTLVPLYAKTQRDRLLDNVSRDRIFQAIRANPGVNLSRIHRLAELGWGVTVYHLKMLEKAGLVFSENGARDRCFFENVPDNRRRAKAVAALANKDSLQRVARVVAEEPHLSQSDVVSRTEMSQRAVSYSLKRLVHQGLVDAHRDGVFVRYTPQPDLVAALEVVADEAADGQQHLAGHPSVGPQVSA